MKTSPPHTPAQTRQILFDTLAHDWKRTERDRVWTAVDSSESPERQSPVTTKSATLETLPRAYLFDI